MVEEGYSSNPYHSSIHAADVLRMMNVVLTRGGVLAALEAVATRPSQDGSFKASIQVSRKSVCVCVCITVKLKHGCMGPVPANMEMRGEARR